MSRQIAVHLSYLWWHRRGVASFVILACAFYCSPAVAQTGDYQFVAKGDSTTAFGRIIIAGDPGSNDGICDAPITPGGDDVQVVLPGNSTPRQVGIRRGPNGVIDTTAGGDDQTTAAICAGANNAFDSVAAGDDINTPSDVRCTAICPTSACILPGDDDVLQTAVAGDDDPRAYLSTGANGILESLIAADDVPGPSVAAFGTGFRDATCVNAGANGVAETALCGNAYPDRQEECDDGSSNSDTTSDACRTTCKLPACGDGIIDPANGESCEDGNTSNSDDCVLGCVVATCGDGIKKTSGSPPFEQCDDGNTLPGDGCSSSCQREIPTDCGNGVVDSPYCSSGITGPCTGANADCDTAPGAGDGVCTVEQCDDGNNNNRDDCLTNCTLASCGDGFVRPSEQCDDGNLSPGDGCSPTCEKECGNGILDGACSQGLVNQACLLDEDCDTSPGAGDGACVTEECDPGLDGLCLSSPVTCSARCTIASCGNGTVECSEECDLAGANGVSGSGCSADCGRTLVGRNELSSDSECPGAWTLDSPPQDLKYRKQVCTDGAACDLDGMVNDKCLFSVGMCINRPQPATCELGPVIAVDVPRLDTRDGWAADAADALTQALGELTLDSFDAPGRCSGGRSRKNCEINSSCDSYLGAGDGLCNVATGVTYLPPLDESNQVAVCTPGQPMVVPVGERLKLRSYVRRAAPFKGDRDNLRLYCIAP